MPIIRGREPWTKEAVWRKLAAFMTPRQLEQSLGRRSKNEKDIGFALRTARDFLDNDREELATALIHSYYGTFWILSTLALVADENLTIGEISAASGLGHGLNLDYKDKELNPLAWTIFIQRDAGFFPFISQKKPFSQDLEKVALPSGVGRAALTKDAGKFASYGYLLDDLYSRVPELGWYYETLTDRPVKCISAAPQYKKIKASKLASTTDLMAWFPFIDTLTLQVRESERMTDHNEYVAIFKDVNSIPDHDLPLDHVSLLTDRDAIARLHRPLNEELIRHGLITYSWSIIARYMPSVLQEVESGSLGNWKPFLEEYNWFLRIRLPTEVLNAITRSEWRFSPPALFGG